VLFHWMPIHVVYFSMSPGEGRHTRALDSICGSTCADFLECPEYVTTPGLKTKLEMKH